MLVLQEVTLDLTGPPPQRLHVDLMMIWNERHTLADVVVAPVVADPLPLRQDWVTQTSAGTGGI